MKILLNYLPPARVEIASAGLSALKGFLEENQVESSIIYWNILFHEILQDYESSADITLSPFMFFLAEDTNDCVAKNRILAYLQKNIPFYKFKSKDDYKDLICSWKERISKMMEEKLKEINFNEVALFGITAKHYQWIPGIVLSRYVKQIHPKTKIVIGGADDKNFAESLLKLSGCFDFAIWGEGEYPLLSLFTQITSGENNLANVPNLLYRKNGQIISSTARTNSSTDLDKIYIKKFDDFFKQIKSSGIDKFEIPIEGSKGCFWNKCKFCTMNKGFIERRRSNQSIVEEIKHFIDSNNIYNFRFVDTSINDAGDNFKTLLNLLVNLNNKCSNQLNFTAEITPIRINADIVKLMSLAGFRRVQIGFEGLSNTILKKLKKIHSLSDNILFVKFAIKYGITVSGSNIMTAYPYETEQEIMESIDAMHFFRFYLNKNGYRFWRVIFSLGKKAAYFNNINNLSDYSFSSIDYYLPKGFIDVEDKFVLLSYSMESIHKTLWDHLFDIQNYYLNNKIEYRLTMENNILHYYEYVNGENIKQVTFNRTEYICILEELNNSVTSLDKLYNKVIKKYHNLDKNDLIEMLSVLRSNYIVYTGKDFLSLISIVDIDTLIKS